MAAAPRSRQSDEGSDDFTPSCKWLSTPGLDLLSIRFTVGDRWFRGARATALNSRSIPTTVRALLRGLLTTSRRPMLLQRRRIQHRGSDAIPCHSFVRDRQFVGRGDALACASHATAIFTQTIVNPLATVSTLDDFSNCRDNQGCLGKTGQVFDAAGNPLAVGNLTDTLTYTFTLTPAEIADIAANPAGIGTLSMTAARDLGLRAGA